MSAGLEFPCHHGKGSLSNLRSWEKNQKVKKNQWPVLHVEASLQSSASLVQAAKIKPVCSLQSLGLEGFFWEAGKEVMLLLKPKKILSDDLIYSRPLLHSLR